MQGVELGAAADAGAHSTATQTSAGGVVFEKCQHGSLFLARDLWSRAKVTWLLVLALSQRIMWGPKKMSVPRPRVHSVK